MLEKYKALLLAGGISKHALKKMTSQHYKALITVGNKNLLITHMIKVLQKTSYFKGIYIAGPKEVHAKIKNNNILALPAGSTLMETLKQNIPIFRDEPYIFISTSDLPLVSSNHIEKFIKDCVSNPGFDIYYPIIEKETYVQAYPDNELKRIYANLVEGSFTGGNVFLVNPKVLIDCADVINQLILFRKHPLKIAKILGRRIAVKYLKRSLTIRDLEKLVPDYFKNYTGKAILAEPEIALDIDKPVQLKALSAILKD